MSSSMKDFKIIQLLGKGSFGSVYKTKRRSDGHYYAVKEVNIRSLSSRERQDAINEIRILASIKHKNIIRYCEAFVERDNLYIVMDFAEGGDINHQIKRATKKNAYIPEDTIWCYFIQMLFGLEEMHRKNILHRDLKPKNIFLTSSKHVRIGDLGCAKLMKTRLTRTQVGTPYYMSPEIWGKRPYDACSDVWALGCILYELCMLKPPFLAADIDGLAKKVKTARTPRVSSRYSNDMTELIGSLLNKDASRRPTVSKLLQSSIIRKRLNLVPANDTGGRWADDDRKSHVLATIKVPKHLGRKKVALNFPSPCYPVKRLYTSPQKGRRGSVSARDPPRDRGYKAPMTSPAKMRSDDLVRLPSVPALAMPNGAGAGAGAGACVAAARGGIVTARDHRQHRQPPGIPPRHYVHDAENRQRRHSRPTGRPSGGHAAGAAYRARRVYSSKGGRRGSKPKSSHYSHRPQPPTRKQPRDYRRYNARPW